MKRVACLSTIQYDPDEASASSQIIDVFNSIRRFNQDNKLTGAVIVADRYLLMIIEGEATLLGNIIFKVRQNQRLKEFSIILNESISQLEFSNLCIKLNKDNSDGHNKIYTKIHRLLDQKVDIKSKKDEQRLDVFIHPEIIANYDKIASSQQRPVAVDISRPKNLPTTFINTVISLSSWPKPGKIKLCPELMKICARLMGKPQRFEDLLRSKVVTSETALNDHLRNLYQLGILRKHDDSTKPQLISISGGLSGTHKPSPNDRFGSVLRNFLSAAKR